ncbi:ribonuclease HI family protein [Chungangia koreensis]|uniref:Ribonuclease HI family protein n=1 Tax=Chungangia koreensis TaxID=752657 RepID=A0ABV8X9J9_9LACT
MLEVYIDAASAGNPGPSGIGVYIKGEGHIVKISEPVGITDNHTAEFMALLRGVQEAEKLSKGFISIRSDSQVVVTAVEKEYVKKEEYKRYLDEALKIANGFDFFFIKWIRDEENGAADQLAREAIQKNNG